MRYFTFQHKVHTMTYDTNRYPVNRGRDGDLGIRNNIQNVLTSLLEYVCSQNGKVVYVLTYVIQLITSLQEITKIFQR